VPDEVIVAGVGEPVPEEEVGHREGEFAEGDDHQSDAQGAADRVTVASRRGGGHPVGEVGRSIDGTVHVTSVV
jgi:hypothetical protein